MDTCGQLILLLHLSSKIRTLNQTTCTYEAVTKTDCYTKVLPVSCYTTHSWHSDNDCISQASLISCTETTTLLYEAALMLSKMLYGISMYVCESGNISTMIQSPSGSVPPKALITLLSPHSCPLSSCVYICQQKLILAWMHCQMWQF